MYIYFYNGYYCSLKLTFNKNRQSCAHCRTLFSIATFRHTPRLSSNGTVGIGNASWIRVFCPESYRTVLTCTARWKRAICDIWSPDDHTYQLNELQGSILNTKLLKQKKLPQAPLAVSNRYCATNDFCQFNDFETQNRTNLEERPN